MGKLVLTRRAGESVIVREANGREWLFKIVEIRSLLARTVVANVLRWDGESRMTALKPGNSYSFAGGSLELRPARCPSQAILAFDFPRDVTILRTEIA